MANACSKKYSYGLKEAHWEDRKGTQRCSYCGSLHPAEAIKLLKTDGTKYSGSDWKYGWPHKFYIGDMKFYNNHLLDATPEEFKELTDLFIKYFHIAFELIDEGHSLQYRYPKTTSIYGYQTWGAVGKKTCQCGCVGGERTGLCQCTADPPCHPDHPEIAAIKAREKQ